jgi:hypothetical protein
MWLKCLIKTKLKLINMDDIIIDDMEEGKALPTNQNNKLNSAHNASNVVPHVQLFEKLLSEITPIDFHCRGG